MKTLATAYAFYVIYRGRMILFVSLFIYLLLYFPFFGLYPFHDGNNEFLIVYNFYKGNYFSHWTAYHPPIKPFLFSEIFHIFGLYSYSYIGYYLGSIGIIALFYITKQLFNKQTAVWSSIFLATSGLYLSNSVFTLNDFLMTVFILIAFLCYLKSRYVWYGIFISCAFLAKESAIVFPVSVLAVSIYFRRKIHLYHFLPVVVFVVWVLFLHSTGHQLWNTWNFSGTASQGSAFTLVYNLVTLKIFNQYAYENWLHLFVFNYNWFFWLFALYGIFSVLRSKKHHAHSLQLLVMLVVFTITYCLTILSFQTYTINRYVLPILPFVYMMAAVGLMHIPLKYIFATIFVIVIAASLLTSDDPVSNKIWKKLTLLNQEIYLGSIDGPDGINYNIQFLQMAKQRDQIILSGNCAPYKGEIDYDKNTFTYFGAPGCKN